MSLNFRPAEISDKPWADELLSYSDYRATEYCFTSIFIWDRVYRSSITRYNDYILVRSENDQNAYYFFPAGKGDLKEVISEMMKDAESLGKKFFLGSLSKSDTELVEGMFPGTFTFGTERNTYDYIYDTAGMISLAGRKYQAKRNHISHFKKNNPDWSYESIDYHDPVRCQALISECRTMNDEWCRLNGCIHNISMNQEKCAVRKAMEFFIPLKLKGGLLRVNGKVVAFTFGEAINSDTFIVHVEKAFYDVDGAYPMINREFLEHEASSFKYVNREDDAGDEGLRTAKLSYHPLFMEEKFYCFKK